MGRRLVLHVLPADRPRGAQALARVVIDQLDGRPDRHEALTLFAAPPGLLEPEHCLEVPETARRLAGVSPVAAWRLRRFVRRARPDAIVSHGGEMLPYLPLTVPRSVPTVYYRVGTADQHLRAPWRRWIYRWLVTRCTRVVAISDETAAEAVELFGDRCRDIALIPNSRDPQRFRPAPTSDPEREELVALYVGDISESKGADRFVRAVRTLRAEGAPVRGVMAGTGPAQASLAEIAADAGVELLGHVADIPGLMASADLLVFPSIGREGMPGVLVEAALCGLPCVASQVPGVPAVVDDGETGFVVDPSDDAALQASVRLLVDDPVLRRRLGAEARRRAVERFSEEAVGERWRALFVSLLGAPAPTPATGPGSPAPGPGSSARPADR